MPPAVTNLTVLAHSVYADVSWMMSGDGGSPLTGFTLSYRRDKSHLSPEEEEELDRDASKVIILFRRLRHPGKAS